MYTATLSSRAAPSYGLRYVSPSKHIKPIPISPIITIKRSLQDFEFMKFINKGDSSIVYLAKEFITDKQVALKIIPKTRMNTVDAANEQRIQATIEKDGEKSFLLPTLASFHDTKNYYLVTEFMPGGDMALELARCKSFNEDRTRIYGAELILAVEELRQGRIIHRDIKPANILIDSQGHLRLIDYGFAKKFEAAEGYEALDAPDASFAFDVDNDCDAGAFLTDVPAPNFKTNEVCGTPHFMSPQRSAGKEYNDEEDVWSVGVVLYLMLTGRLPFGDATTDPIKIAYSIQHEPLEFKSTDLVSDDAKVLLIGMLTKDPRTRLSIEQIKAHNFFKGIDWAQIARKEHQAPWVPFLAPLPKIPMAHPPNIAGGIYEDWTNPLPSYTYTSPKLDASMYSPVQVEEVKAEPSAFKKFGSAIAKFLTQKKKHISSFDSVCNIGKTVTKDDEVFFSPKAQQLLEEIEERINEGVLTTVDSSLFTLAPPPPPPQHAPIAKDFQPSMGDGLSTAGVPPGGEPPVQFASTGYLQPPKDKKPVMSSVATPKPSSAVVEVWDAQPSVRQAEGKAERPHKTEDEEPYGGLDIFGSGVPDSTPTPTPGDASARLGGRLPSTPTTSHTTLTASTPTTSGYSPTPTVVDHLTPPPPRVVKPLQVRKQALPSGKFIKKGAGHADELKDLRARRDHQEKLEEETRKQEYEKAAEEEAKRKKRTAAEWRIQDDKRKENQVAEQGMKSPKLPETPLKKGRGQTGGWETRERGNSNASQLSYTSTGSFDDDKYTYKPVRRRSALGIPAPRVQLPSCDQSGPLPVPNLQGVLEPARSVFETGEEQGEQKRQSMTANVVDCIHGYLGKMFGSARSGCGSAPVAL